MRRSKCLVTSCCILSFYFVLGITNVAQAGYSSDWSAGPYRPDRNMYPVEPQGVQILQPNITTHYMFMTQFTIATLGSLGLHDLHVTSFSARPWETHVTIVDNQGNRYYYYPNNFSLRPSYSRSVQNSRFRTDIEALLRDAWHNINR